MSPKRDISPSDRAKPVRDSLWTGLAPSASARAPPTPARASPGGRARVGPLASPRALALRPAPRPTADYPAEAFSTVDGNAPRERSQRCDDATLLLLDRRAQSVDSARNHGPTPTIGTRASSVYISTSVLGQRQLAACARSAKWLGPGQYYTSECHASTHNNAYKPKHDTTETFGD